MDTSLIALAHSPGQDLQLDIRQEGCHLCCSLLYRGAMLLDNSRLGLDVAGKEGDPLVLRWTDMRALPDDGVELMTAFDWGGDRFLVRFLLRDDRLAFRYELEGLTDERIVGERTCFHFGLDANLLVDHTTEGVVDARDLGLPVLLEMDNGLYISVQQTPSILLPEPRLRLDSGRHLEAIYTGPQEARTEGYLITSWWILTMTQP